MKFRKPLPSAGFSIFLIIPLLNVIVLFMAFFVLFMPFVQKSVIPIQLPKVITSGKIQNQNLLLTVSSENLIFLNQKLITINELETSLRKNKNKQSVLLQIDRRASMGRVLDIWNICRSLGLQEINVATTIE